MFLRQNLLEAQPGDYLVTAQSKNYTVLLIRSKNANELNIEEITIPKEHFPKKNSFRNWVVKGAPGHTCWVMYTIDLPTGMLKQTFSFTKNQWLMVSQSHEFLSTLLNLKLNRVPQRERKKIGPPPSNDKIDKRPYWQPNLIVDGNLVEGVSFDAWRTFWPKDGSELSGKLIEVYLPKESEKYPSYFPYWLQVSGVVGNAKVRIVDSGTRLFSYASQNE